MQSNSLVLHRRKEIVGTLAWIAWAGGLLEMQCSSAGALGAFLIFAGWALTAVWVALDDCIRRGHYSAWPVLALLTGPVGFVLYYVARRPAPRICSRCGSVAPAPAAPCPMCGHAAPLVRGRLALSTVYTSLSDSLVRRPVEHAKETARNLAFALAAAAIVAAALTQFTHRFDSLLGLIWVLTAAAYWVLVAWWVYLDSAWRKMDGMPWAVLTLVTNVVGLVTYLVIRYPDPRLCAFCGQSVPVGLKYCPHCGSEAEPMCPHCQAAIKPEWQFCPVCAARLSAADAEPARTTPGVTLTGSVLDAIEGTPIEGALVQIDSAADKESATTDSLGRFELAGLDERPYVLVASRDGYASQARPYSPGTKDRHIRFSLYRDPSIEVETSQTKSTFVD